MDGSRVTVNLLQCCVAAGVPDGDGAVFTARNQQGPRWIQTNGVHLSTGATQAMVNKANSFVYVECSCHSDASLNPFKLL